MKKKKIPTVKIPFLVDIGPLKYNTLNMICIMMGAQSDDLNC